MTTTNTPTETTTDTKPKRYVDGCNFCDSLFAEHGDKLILAPSHAISSRCNQPNPGTHCTCDACF